MDTILFPIMYIIAWIMTGVHKLLTLLGMPEGVGATWVLSIVGMTILVRALTIPLVTKQMKAMRMGQEIQPELQKIRKKYKGRKDPISQRRMQEETMALYREKGSSPFSSCLPMLVQLPIFLSLFRLLYAVEPLAKGTYSDAQIGPINQTIADQINSSTVFGAPLSSSIGTAGAYENSTAVYIVAIVMIVLLIATLFFTQKQIMTKNMPESALDPDNPAYKMQKYMLYGMPMIYIFTGTTFQVGVLVYWVTSNIWNIGQQTWVIRRHPAVGSLAYKEKMRREREKRIAKGLPPEDHDSYAVNDEASTGQRMQPLGKSRSKKAGGKVDAFGRPLKEIQNEAYTPEETVDEEVRGADGLTDAERARKRYERRAAERQRTQQKKQARAKKQAQNKKNRNF